jgi:uncharacterized membrane protein YbaN (DUF454 family)
MAGVSEAGPRGGRGGGDHTANAAVLECLLVAAPVHRLSRMDLRPVTDPLRGFLYCAGGWACVGLAVLGSVLPLLPTTPFLLLASWCFYRGSPRIHAWLHRSSLFGPTLDDWQHYHGLRRGVKHRTIVMVLAVVLVSLLLNSLPWWLRWVTFGLVGVGLYVIWTVPTLPDDAPRAPRTIAE